MHKYFIILSYLNVILTTVARDKRCTLPIMTANANTDGVTLVIVTKTDVGIKLPKRGKRE